ncbi:MAG TPA: hypothetical protein DCL43_12280 [Chitinophagaceae bacterium]|nr:hypothetical protein [Chitinophagaceae bacterium]HAN39514.1 hypothetical protein [Chitinophagaceae bacterium]
MKILFCPKCKHNENVKAGVLDGRQRYKCKHCSYHFTTEKEGKQIDPYYVVKALQLYIEGVSYREIERILGVSHVSVMNWVKKHRIKAPDQYAYRPTYKVMNISELAVFMSNPANLKNSGMMISELGDKYMLIKWERMQHV